MIEQGYFKKVESPVKNSRTWHKTYHDVYHPESPGKVRELFDYSANFNKVSFNGNLRQKPDFTNSLLVVLLKFGVHKMSIKANIEAMLHQIRVPKNN